MMSKQELHTEKAAHNSRVEASSAAYRSECATIRAELETEESKQDRLRMATAFHKGTMNRFVLQEDMINLSLDFADFIKKATSEHADVCTYHAGVNMLLTGGVSRGLLRGPDGW